MRSRYVPLVLVMLFAVGVALTAVAQSDGQQPSAMDPVVDLLDHAMSSALAPEYSETWSIFGNNFGGPGHQFYLGTADFNPLHFKTDGLTRMVVQETGEVTVVSDLRVGQQLSIGSFVPAQQTSLLYVKGAASGHLAYFESTASSGGDGVAIELRSNTEFANSSNRFLTFYDGNESIAREAGWIEGYDLNNGDATIFNPPATLPFPSLSELIQITGFTVSDDCESCGIVPFPLCEAIGDLCIDPDNFGISINLGSVVDALVPWVCWTINSGLSGMITTNPLDALIQAEILDLTLLCKNGGVTYASYFSKDYAEWLPKLDPAEKMTPGQIVGLHGGRISKRTQGADQIMSVSLAPVVVGNVPAEGEEDAWAMIAFIGQAPVWVWGHVDVGDFIVPSGRNDGFGLAVASEDLRPEQLPFVLGRAWEASTNDRVSLINVLVGRTNEVAEVVHRQADQISQLEERVGSLIRQLARFEDLDQRLAMLEGRAVGADEVVVLAVSDR